jgi:hypothetical protein
MLSPSKCTEADRKGSEKKEDEKEKLGKKRMLRWESDSVGGRHVLGRVI